MFPRFREGNGSELAVRKINVAAVSEISWNGERREGS